MYDVTHENAEAGLMVENLKWKNQRKHLIVTDRDPRGNYKTIQMFNGLFQKVIL